MAFDLNNPPDHLEEEAIPAAADGDGGPCMPPGEGAPCTPPGHGFLDLNNSPVQEPEGAPVLSGEGGAAQGAEGAAVNLLDLTMEPNLDDEEYESDNVGIAHSNATARRRLVVISDQQRNAVYRGLLAASQNGKLKNDSTRNISASTGVHRRTVQRIWTDHKKQIAEGLDPNVGSKKPNRVGRKKIDV